ncbi:MAG: HAMP domain-containing sensor histidine kinase [Hyphomonadaceae bacterium]|nr:HAMP domain-containing sensor histidine kinase [Hyphomonadaceae bacterium]
MIASMGTERNAGQPLAARAPREAPATPTTSEWSLSAAEATAFIRKATWPRVLFAAVALAVTWPVAPQGLMAAWLVGVIAWEFAVRPALEDRLLARAEAMPAPVAYRWLAALHGVGACLYAVFPVTSWATGTVLGMVAATSWFCATANHAFVYFSHQRTLLLATILPLIVCALAAPFTTMLAAPPVSIVGMIVLVSALVVGGLFGHDRNELLRALSRTRAARAAAESASASKSQFMALVSHELRTPLNAVIGYAEIIAQEAPPAAAADAGRILKAAHRQLDLINAIIDLSRLETGEATLARVRGPVTAALARVRADAAPLADAGANTLDVRAMGDPGDAVLDFERLHDALMRLASNAAKFTQGGAITVTAERVRDAHGADQIVFAVRDTGPGIAPAAQAAIFEPFTQSDASSARAHEGAGLGLAIARQTARLMGGDITCQSAPGAGSVFTLRIPADHAG